MLTLGFIRQLVETLAIGDEPPLATSNNKSNYKRGNDVTTYPGSDEPRREMRGVESTMAVEVPPWADVSAALRCIREFSAEKGVHDRLINVMPLTACQALVSAIARAFWPPPEAFRRHKRHNIRGEFDSFLGAVVREKLTCGCRACRHRNDCITTDADGGGVGRYLADEDDSSGSARGEDSLASAVPGDRRTPWSDVPIELPEKLFMTEVEETSWTENDLASVDRLKSGHGVKHSAFERDEGTPGGSLSISSGDGYSTSTFIAEDEMSVSFPSGRDVSGTTVFTSDEPIDQPGRDHSGSTDGDANGRFIDASTAAPEAPVRQEVPETSTVRCAFRAGRENRYLHPGGLDVATLAEMQRANSHVQFPELARDARMFACALATLAAGRGMAAATPVGEHDTQSTDEAVGFRGRGFQYDERALEQ